MTQKYDMKQNKPLKIAVFVEQITGIEPVINQMFILRLLPVIRIVYTIFTFIFLLLFVL